MSERIALPNVVVSPLDNASASFAWERPTAELARSTGGSLTHGPMIPAKNP